MVAEKKIHHESGGPSLQDRCDETDDALSLCDLPMYGDYKSGEWTDHGFSEESPDQDFFEFSSQDFTSNSSSSTSQPFSPENIVFCGKIIPSRQPDVFISTGRAPDKPRKQRGRMSRWRSLLLRWGISSNRRRSSVDKYGRTLQNHRWYLFVFGVGRFPMEMELRDIKTRQSRLIKAGKGPTSPVYVNGTTSEKKSWNLHEICPEKASRIGCMPLIL